MLGVQTDNDRFVEYETGEDLQQAVDKLDGADFKGSVVRCIADVCSCLSIFFKYTDAVKDPK